MYHFQFTNCLRVPSPISEALTFTSIDQPAPVPLFNAISNETLWQKLTDWFIDSPPSLRLLDPHFLALGILDLTCCCFPKMQWQWSVSPRDGIAITQDLEKPEAATVSNVRNCVQSRLWIVLVLILSQRELFVSFSLFWFLCLSRSGQVRSGHDKLSLKVRSGQV